MTDQFASSQITKVPEFSFRRKRIVFIVLLTFVFGSLIIVFHVFGNIEETGFNDNRKLRHFSNKLKTSTYNLSYSSLQDNNLSLESLNFVWGRDFVDNNSTTIPQITNNSDVTNAINETTEGYHHLETQSSPIVPSESELHYLQREPVIFPTFETLRPKVYNKTMSLQRKYMQYIYDLLSSPQTKPIGIEKYVNIEANVLKDLHKALVSGDPCSASVDINTRKSSILAALTEYWSTSSSNYEKIFFEISSSYIDESVAYYLAMRSSEVTSIHIQSKSTEGDIISDTCRDFLRPSNLLIGDAIGVSESSGYEYFDCVQYIEDLSLLVYEFLPFEFEQYIGKLLCRCQYTVLPKDLQPNSFFSYWDSLEDLLSRAVETIPRGECNLSVLSSKHSEKGLANLQYYSLISVERYMTNLTNYVTKNSQIIEPTINHFTIKTLLAFSLDYYSMQSIATDISIFSNTDNILDCDKLKWRNLTNSFNPNSILSEFVLAGSGIISICEVIIKPLYYESFESNTSSGSVIPTSSPTLNPWVSSFDKLQSILKNNDTPTSIPILSVDSSNQHRRLLSLSSASSDSSSLDSIELELPANQEILLFEGDLNQYEVSHDNSISQNSQISEFSSQKLFSSREFKDRLRSLQEREEVAYTRWMRVLKAESFESPKSIILLGRQITLISTKLAKKYLDQGTLVVSILTDSEGLESHQTLVDSRKLVNNIICYNKLELSSFGGLQRSPDRADVGIIQVDAILSVFIQSIQDIALTGNCNIDTFNEALYYYFSMSKSVFVELPSPNLLKVIAFALLQNNLTCYQLISNIESIDDIIEVSVNVLRQTNTVDVVNTETIIDDFIHPFKSSILKISVTKNTSDVIHEDSPSTILMETAIIGQGISLYSLLHFGILKRYKQSLFRLFLELPIWYLSSHQKSELSPSKIFISIQRVASTSTLTMRFIDSTDLNVIGANLNSGLIASHINTSRIFYRGIMDELSKHTAELAEGRFSFVEYDSGYGYLSSRISKSFPNSTVISIERDSEKTAHHLAMVKSLGIMNNAICTSIVEDFLIHRNVFDSPELFRFQLRTKSLIDEFVASYGLPNSPPTTYRGEMPARSSWGQFTGHMLSSALTTFASIPLPEQFSYGYFLFFGGIAGTNYLKGSSKPISLFERDSSAFVNDISILNRFTGYTDLMSINNHPVDKFSNFANKWLLESAWFGEGSANISVTPIHLNLKSKTSGDRIVQLPLYRFDLVNMSRYVHHHYDYLRDGHTRTYSMHVEVDQSITEDAIQFIKSRRSSPYDISHSSFDVDISSLDVSSTQKGITLYDKVSSFPSRHQGYVLPPGFHPNQHRIVSVGIHRDKDNWLIPYTTIYGVTLISVLRMGLIPEQRESFFKHFLKLPLYEDMAPWNIVLMGSTLDYIDYDTKDLTFDTDIKKAYQIMTVLMNYKRTIEDFQKCGSKAATVYGLPYVSECVGQRSYESSLKCPEIKLPVPCGDGKCYSDYISCLRAVADEAENLAAAAFGSHK